MITESVKDATLSSKERITARSDSITQHNESHLFKSSSCWDFGTHPIDSKATMDSNINFFIIRIIFGAYKLTKIFGLLLEYSP